MREIWRKSSHSNGGGECVEVAFADGRVSLRDSKSPDTGMIRVPAAAMAALLHTLTSD